MLDPNKLIISVSSYGCQDNLLTSKAYHYVSLKKTKRNP